MLAISIVHMLNKKNSEHIASDRFKKQTLKSKQILSRHQITEEQLLVSRWYVCENEVNMLITQYKKALPYGLPSDFTITNSEALSNVSSNCNHAKSSRAGTRHSPRITEPHPVRMKKIFRKLWHRRSVNPERKFTSNHISFSWLAFTKLWAVSSPSLEFLTPVW
jgi:hypothetical protein